MAISKIIVAKPYKGQRRRQTKIPADAAVADASQQTHASNIAVIKSSVRTQAEQIPEADGTVSAQLLKLWRAPEPRQAGRCVLSSAWRKRSVGASLRRRDNSARI